MTLVAMVSAGMPKITDDVSRAISQMRLDRKEGVGLS